MGNLIGRALAWTVATGTLLGVCAATAPASSKPETPAVAYQLNAQHTGVTADRVAAKPRKRWSVTFSDGISYPLIVGDRVYVTVAGGASGPGSRLYALSAATGARVWGPVELGGGYFWSGLTYAAGRVFTVNYNGMVEAFNAVNGDRKWAKQLPVQTGFDSPPTAAGGYVYVGGAGSLYAIRQSNGAVKWTRPVDYGGNSSPAVSASGVYVSYDGGQTYDFAPSSGRLIWHRATRSEGVGGKTPVLAGGRLYVRDVSYPAVLGAGTGRVLGPFSKSGPAPAVDSSHVYDLEGPTLTARGLHAGARGWSFTGDGSLASAPLVVGSRVFVGGTSGKLYALSSNSGRVTWSTNVGSSITAPDEQDLGQPLTGLAASGGLLVVPAGERLVAYR
jgi:outer membrane protein assembly factor BamB